MSNNGKKKHGFWLTPGTKDKIETYYKIDNCKSQSEFLEKAVNFYIGYVCTENASAYLPRVLSDVLEGKFAVIKKKLGRIMFKHSVETNITNHILCADTDIDVPTYERLRNRSVREVLETNGELKFDDALRCEAALHSFTSGYRLACGIHRELSAEPIYSFDREEEERSRQSILSGANE